MAKRTWGALVACIFILATPLAGGAPMDIRQADSLNRFYCSSVWIACAGMLALASRVPTNRL